MLKALLFRPMLLERIAVAIKSVLILVKSERDMKRNSLKTVIILIACLLIIASAVAQLAVNTTGNEFATQQSQSGTNGRNVLGFVQMCLNAQGIAVPADAAGVN